MNTDDKQPTDVANELEGLKNFLDENIPTLNETIPTLDESIPVLDEPIEIPQDIKVSFDISNSTETIEQQLIRTRHENQAPAPTLISDDIPDQDEMPVLEEPHTLTDEVTTVLTDVSSNMSSEQTAKLPNFTFVLEEDEPLESDNIEEGNLEQQQQEIESEANDLRDRNNANEVLLEKAWTKLEMLLMDNLPTQLSGTFLQLLNTQIDENKQQIFNELSLLDDELFQELSDDLDDSIDDEGF